MIKKLPLILAFVSALTGFANAQQTPLTNSQNTKQAANTRSDDQSRASRYSNMFARLLNLDVQQHEKVNQIALARLTALGQLPNRTAQSEKNGHMSEEERQIRSQFNKSMDNILIPEQKIKWDQYRSQIRQRKDNIRNGQKDASFKAGNAGSQNPVLLPEDDGFDD
jgi:hypothetical protein